MATITREALNVKTENGQPLAAVHANGNGLPSHLPARGQLARALCGAQQFCRAVDKDSTNNYHNYKYASCEAVIIEAKRALADTGLALVPVEMTVNGHEKDGESRFELCRKFLLIHDGGESIPLAMHWPVVPDRGRPLDKAVAAACTSSLGYLLRDLLQMPRVDPTDDISGRDDTGHESKQRKRKPAPAKPDTQNRENGYAKPTPAPEPSTNGTGSNPVNGAYGLTYAQMETLNDLLQKLPNKKAYSHDLLKAFGVARFGEIAAANFEMVRMVIELAMKPDWLQDVIFHGETWAKMSDEDKAEAYQAVYERWSDHMASLESDGGDSAALPW